jgi:hypothetical protein
MNRHLRCKHYETVERSERKPRLNIQSCVRYWVCFGMRGVVLFKSRDVKIVKDAAGALNTGGKDNGGAGGRRNIYTQVPAISWFKVQLVSFVG